MPTNPVCVPQHRLDDKKILPADTRKTRNVPSYTNRATKIRWSQRPDAIRSTPGAP